ncbi:MAG: dienelactone hydrolase [Pseudomonadota bacterium]
MRRLLSLVLVALSSFAHAQTNVDLGAKRGTYGVGLQVIQQYDSSREYIRRPEPAAGVAGDSERARPVLTLVWYPTRESGGTVTNADYLRISRGDEQFDLTPQEIDRKVDAWVSARATRMPREAVQKELQQAMWAQRDAAPAQGKYPLVIYAPGFGSAALENAELCEYLASHGYVVMASASMGSRSRAMTPDLDGIEAQAADIAFLIGSAHRFAQTDLAHIGVIGFSWGGISNVVAAARDNRIRALVSLDGALRYAPAFVNGSAGAAKDVSPARVAVPLLFVASRSRSIEELNSEKTDTSYSFMNGMNNSDVYIATMRPMRHLDFASQILRFTPPDMKDEYARKDVHIAYGWTVRYVHEFLDAYLKDSAPARAFLVKPASENGAPSHMMTLEQRLTGGTTSK